MEVQAAFGLEAGKAAALRIKSKGGPDRLREKHQAKVRTQLSDYKHNYKHTTIAQFYVCMKQGIKIEFSSRHQCTIGMTFPSEESL